MMYELVIGLAFYMLSISTDVVQLGSSSSIVQEAAEGPGEGGGEYSFFKKHPDVVNERAMPGWAKPSAAAVIFNDLSFLMNIPVRSTHPYIRFWPNITAQEREECPNCTPGENYFVESRSEIWLGSDQNQEDMIMEILKYLQAQKRGYDSEMLESNVARGEREFFRRKLCETFIYRTC